LGFLQVPGSVGQAGLPGHVDLNYTSTNNQMWIRLSAKKLGTYFEIKYSTIPTNFDENIYTNCTGWINSTACRYAETYPRGPVECQYAINITDPHCLYSDIVLSLNLVDVSGKNGDYIKLGPGLNYTEDQYGALVSWTLDNRPKLLINGPLAYVVFKTFRPVENFENRKGFAIYYETVVKNLTTPAPPTTTEPPTPTPFPLDPRVLLTNVVFLKYRENTSACNETACNGTACNVTDAAKIVLLDIFVRYTYKNNINLTKNLSLSSINISATSRCYSGWVVNSKTCAQLTISVNAVKQLSTNESISDFDYAFPSNVVKAAIREFNKEDSACYPITLPDDLLNIYYVAIGVGVGVVIVVLLICLLSWKHKLRVHYKEENRYKNIKSRDDSKGHLSKANPNEKFSEKAGISNPAFEGDDPLAFDPNNRKLYHRYSVYGNKAPPAQTSNLYGQSMGSSTENDYEEASSISAGESIKSAQIQPHSNRPMPTVGAATRGILKKTTFTMPAQTDDENFEDVTLYDNSTRAERVIPARTSTHSESQYPLYLGSEGRDSFGETHL